MQISVWILGDQLLLDHPALRLAEEQVGRDRLTVLMVESEARARRLPYQAKKLVLLFSAMRHFASRLRSSGFEVDYRISTTATGAIQEHIEAIKPEVMFTMQASEYHGREFQENLEKSLNIPVKILPNTQFLTGHYNPIPEPLEDKRYVQESFYRKMRTHFNLLLKEDGEPVGGKWNFDKENRRRLPKGIQISPPISFIPDRDTQQVMEEIDHKFPGIGETRGFNLGVTHEEAQQAADDFFEKRLPDFGAYEDAMSGLYDTINHSRLSPYLNIGLLDPLELAIQAQRRYEEGKAPLNSVEGFIRQVVGWREYMYWQYWRLMPEILNRNYWEADRPLPEFFWNGDTNLNCLRHVILRALSNGYTHHIERLMVVSNFCLLCGIDPNQVNEWFLGGYIDAYEWVMIPNVYGMGLYADGGQISTKPYISSANYINKMSDYCQECFYDHRLRIGEAACPFNYLYWNFILEKEAQLRSNPRMGRSLLGLQHLEPEDRFAVRDQAEKFFAW